MANIILRTLQSAVFLVLVLIIVFAIRNAMHFVFESHSIWHYYFRLFILVFVASLAVDIVRSISTSYPLEVFGFEIPTRPPFKLSNVVKRMVDLGVSIVFLMLVAPILVIVCFLIYILEGSPVFYISKRYISLSKCVSTFKFRTMVKNATSPEYRLTERFMRGGYLDIPLDCEVYTPVGRFLERTQIVEILQMVNVIIDGMSLVGNRPLPESNVKILQGLQGWQQRFRSPAGLSGISQIVGKMNQTPEQRMRLECLYSEVYINKSANILICDVFIVYNTFLLIFFGKTLPYSKAYKFMERAAAKGRS